MKALTYALTLLAVLVGAIGCGGGSSSGEAQDGNESVAAERGMTGAATGQVEGQHKERPGQDRTVQAPIPTGTRKDTKIPRVQRAIADLLHPESGDGGQRKSHDDHPGQDKKGGHDGSLGRALEYLRRQARRLDPVDHQGHDDNGVDILELLK